MTQSLDLDAVERVKVFADWIENDQGRPSSPYSSDERGDAQAAADLRALLSLLREAEKRGEAWDWLAQHTNLELSWGELDDLDDTAWRVHRCSGGVNDREWDLISTGQTPLEAIQNARQALSQLTQKEAGNG